MSTYSNTVHRTQPENIHDFNWAMNQLNGRDRVDVLCPHCSHTRKPENRHKKCLRLTRGQKAGVILFKCINCNEGGVLYAGSSWTPPDPRIEEQRRRHQAEQNGRRNEDKALWIQSVWQESQAARGTAAEDYFASRSLPVPEHLWNREIRYVPAFRFRKEGVIKPTIVLPMRSIYDKSKVVGLHAIALDVGVSRETIRTYIHQGEKLKRTYKLLGHKAAIMTGWPEDGRLAVCEGFETGLGVLALGKWNGALWAFTGASHMAGLPVVPYVDELHIFADHDHENKEGVKAGCDAALELMDRFERSPTIVRCTMPRSEGDYADMAEGKIDWREFIVTGKDE